MSPENSRCSQMRPRSAVANRWSSIAHRSKGRMPVSPQNLLRVSVGLEHPDDLIADWQQALGLANHHAPVFGIDAHGSCGGRWPSCSSSIEMRSGERTNAMCPSRGGRLIVTPIFCRRSQVA